MSSPEQLLEARIALYERQIVEALAPYEAASAAYAWFDTLRAMEECINLIHVVWDDETFAQKLFSLPVVGLQENSDHFSAVRLQLVARFGRNFASRFTRLLLQGSSIAAGFAHLGLFEVTAGFYTVGTMMGYLQSRRRHFVGLLHMLPTACRGQQIVEPLDTLNIFIPTIELMAVPMMGAQNELIVRLSHARLGIPGGNANELVMLDPLFLEPERARITEMPMTEEGLEILNSRETLRPDRLFSAAELRNDILAIEALYNDFHLSATDFSPAAAIVRRLSTDFTDRDFWIKIHPAELAALWDEFEASPALRSAFVNTSPSYMACLSTYAPLVLVNGVYLSTVTSPSRFIYYWRGQCLARHKRYQICAGFIFEKAVATALEQQGFEVQDITRINRHEFDVVTVRDAVIWNVQCKNNFVDLESVENNPRRFASYNRRLVRSYERALAKERNREYLLKAKLSLSTIEHMVVSRFPVISDNPRIVPFSRIHTLAGAADTQARHAITTSHCHP